MKRHLKNVALIIASGTAAWIGMYVLEVPSGLPFWKLMIAMSLIYLSAIVFDKAWESIGKC